MRLVEAILGRGTASIAVFALALGASAQSAEAIGVIDQTGNAVNSHAKKVTQHTAKRLGMPVGDRPASIGVPKRMTLKYPRTRCKYSPVRPADAQAHYGDEFDPVVYRYVYRLCGQVAKPGDQPSFPNAALGVNREQFMSRFAVNPQTDAQREELYDVVSEMIAEATASIELPAPVVVTSPEAPNPAIVNLPTWWAVTNASEKHSSSISADVITVRVNVKAVGSEWEPSYKDGGAEPFTRCPGIGIRWREGLSEDEPQACKYTYKWPKSGETATVATLWEAEYWVTVDGKEFAHDVLPNDIATESTHTLNVFERHALVTR